jgi:plastocyanin
MVKTAWLFAAVAGAALLIVAVGIAGGHSPAPDARIVEAGRPNRWAFEPAELSVAPGTTLRWRNDGDHPHTVSADDGSFDSGTIAPGSTWAFRFEEPGEYRYHCAPHRWMRAVVRVGAR